MQIVGPTLGPIFPWMGARVSAYIALLPIGRRAAFIMILEGILVVLTLVAEQLPEEIEPVAVLNQPIPIVVADFVPKMAQERSVRLVHCQSPLFALHIV